ncbi:MAG: PKD domain-containing protein, partial [Saprospiraceae bacterium]
MAGQLYYIEALQKEGTGGDNLAVGWQLPNGAQERPIPGIRLLPYGSAPPTAAFTAGPASGNAPLTVSFDASSSTDADGSVASYAWDFGDGTSGNGGMANHTYTAAGIFTATLTVTDNDGNAAAASLAISVNGTGPQTQTINFPAIANKLTTDAPFLISATATSGLPVSFSIVSGPATVAGNSVTLAGTAGTVIVRASQAGDANWNPAAPMDRSFSIIEQQAGGVDLEMTMSANPAILQVYNDMSFTATLINAGTQAATGVKVHFPKPSGVVFVGGNEYSVSQGSFGLYTDLVWSVGTLAPGAIATITQNYFVLQPSPLTA